MVRQDIHLNVIGTGDSIDEYKAICDELGISDRVNWHGPIFEEIKIAEIMLSSHALIYTGAVGLSLIHGFNYGLPAIIHSDERQHMPEFAAFENRVNGFSFEKNNLNDLSDKINELQSLESSIYVEMSNNAFKTVANSYNIDNMVYRFNNMIEEIRR